MGFLRRLLVVAAAAQLIVAKPISNDGQVPENLLEKRQQATFGPHVSLGQANSEFVELTTIFVPGHPPAKTVGHLFVWPGLFDQKNRSDGDLIQTVVEAAEEKTMQLTCLAGPGQWYVEHYQCWVTMSLHNLKVCTSVRGQQRLQSLDPGSWQTSRWPRSNQNQSQESSRK
jgi:hypothetical protein